MCLAMRDPATPRVFLSYSRKDGLEFARRLQAMLEAEGLSLYRDLSHLDGGEDWWRQVETAIKSVEHVVMVLTPSCAPVTLRIATNGSWRARKASPSGLFRDRVNLTFLPAALDGAPAALDGAGQSP